MPVRGGFFTIFRTMKVISLQSGSNGNSFYVEADDVRLLFDAGITGKLAEERLASHGRDIRACRALFITHDHADHTCGMGVFHRKFRLPVYVTQKTLSATLRQRAIGPLHDVRFFSPGESISFETGSGPPVSVHTIPTPHDAADGVAYIIEYGEKRIGILTDLGHVFDGLREVLLSLDGVIIESNYDGHLLESGPYPETLKRRIRGKGGHLSNEECAGLLARTAMFRRLKWACLCHLSAENNCPDLALATSRRAVDPELRLYVASRNEVSDILEV